MRPFEVFWIMRGHVENSPAARQERAREDGFAHDYDVLKQAKQREADTQARQAMAGAG